MAALDANYYCTELQTSANEHSSSKRQYANLFSETFPKPLSKNNGHFVRHEMNSIIMIQNNKNFVIAKNRSFWEVVQFLGMLNFKI